MSFDSKKSPKPSAAPSEEPLLGNGDDLGELDALQPFEGEAPPQETCVVSIEEITRRAATDQAGPPSAAFAGAKIEPLPATVKVMLEFRSGPAPTRLSKTVTVIGQAQGVADVVVPDDGRVSRQHAAVVWADGGFFLEDLESSNGTFVRNERIKRIKLKMLDEFRLGTYVARLRAVK
jgi:hypothetical protein